MIAAPCLRPSVQARGGGRLSEGPCSDEPSARPRPSPSALHCLCGLPEERLRKEAHALKGRHCRVRQMRTPGSSETETEGWGPGPGGGSV